MKFIYAFFKNEEKEEEMLIIEMLAFWENLSMVHSAGKERKGEVEPNTSSAKIGLQKDQG